jgi:hypothetical protein
MTMLIVRIHQLVVYFDGIRIECAIDAPGTRVSTVKIELNRGKETEQHRQHSRRQRARRRAKAIAFQTQ